jgi:hypothetical protein
VDASGHLAEDFVHSRPVCPPCRMAREQEQSDDETRAARMGRLTNPQPDAFSVSYARPLMRDPSKPQLRLCTTCPDARTGWQINWESVLGDRRLCLACDEYRALLDIQTDDGESRSRVVRMRRWPPVREDVE